MSDVRTRPILFSGEMVRAILAGRKTQTRRLVRLPPSDRVIARIVPSNGARDLWDAESEDGRGIVWHSMDCPYGAPGDHLWVRETWAPHDEGVLSHKDRSGIYYRADDETRHDTDGSWRPSIFMPRWASRITLEVTDVRVQRLQEISEEDARAEGVDLAVQAAGGYVEGGYYRGRYSILWDQINGKRAHWKSSPWVWCISFRRADARPAEGGA